MHRARIALVALLAVLAAGYSLATTLNRPSLTALTTSGTIMATEVSAAPEVAGRVTDVLVQEGEKVRRGDPVARLDNAALDLQLRQAQAALVAAEARVAEARTDLRRWTPEQVKQLEAAADQARATVDLAKLNLDRAVVKAPADGVVLRRLVEPGALVPAGASLTTLANLDDLWLRVYVPENQLHLVKLGTIAEVKVDAFPTQAFQAEVVAISDRAEFTPRNVQTREARITTVYAVKLRLREGLAGELKPGMPADVTFANAETGG